MLVLIMDDGILHLHLGKYIFEFLNAQNFGHLLASWFKKIWHSYVKQFPSIPIGMNLFHMVILIITDFDYNKLPQEFMLYT